MKYEYEALNVDVVAENIDEYIIPECQEACKALWEKNIFTRMCSNRSEGDFKYIAIAVLSKENEEIFRRLIQTNPENYSYAAKDGSFDIYMFGGDNEETAKKLKELTAPFCMQEVLEGITTVQSFLNMNFGELTTVPNPKFNIENKPKREDFDSEMEYMLALASFNNIPRTKYEFVFDMTKMDKSVEEYLEEAGVLHLYDAERGVIYRSEFYKDAQSRYLEYMKTQNKDEKLAALMEEDGKLDEAIKKGEQELGRNANVVNLEDE